MALFSVARWIDIFTAGQNQTRDGIEHCGSSAIARERGDDQWYEACIFEGSYVGGGKPDTTGIAFPADASGNSNSAGWNRLARGRHE